MCLKDFDRIVGVGKIVNFYPYPHTVTNKIISIDCSSFQAEIDYNVFRRLFCEKAKEKKIKAHIDNKIVFELKIYYQTIFIGFHDCVFSIGFGVRKLD